MSNIAYFLAGWFSSWLIYLPPRLTPILNIFFLLSYLPASFNEISWFHLHFTFTDSYILNISLMVWISYLLIHAFNTLSKGNDLLLVSRLSLNVSLSTSFANFILICFHLIIFLKSLFILGNFLYTTCFNMKTLCLSNQYFTRIVIEMVT